ncbi:MAG: hypothetical protein COA71_14500 [SAR86 cluster bacterium]|uniref:Uncharacterized protein n=1 Tax=SAR86 cluster bacterium TaxID=2030880 RepID=A0A2A5C6J4_9GAMM|nr:MAG: hypothetical protein COA71_14500 [SAR86 cluster bacterium]
MNTTCNKIAFGNKADALLFIKDMKRQLKYQSTKNKGKLRTYECHFCGEWHLTSKKKHKRKTA